MSNRIAIIDLGTNTFHLMIAELSNDEKYDTIYREKQAVKIGVGGINKGIITQEGLDRALKCLVDFSQTLQEYHVNSVKAFGTSALRSASNNKEVIEKIKNETGIEVTLISGDQEAEYIYYGVRDALNLGDEKSLIVDIGGGSVEFIIGNGDQIFWEHSFDIGGQRLLELYHRHDPILNEEIAALNLHFEKSLLLLHQMMEKFKPEILAGSSGTFDTLSEIYCLKNHIDISGHPAETPLTIAAFFDIHQQLVSKNRAQRMQIPGMIEMRVDMIVVGSLLVKYLIDQFEFQSIRVSTYSLKEGVLAQWNLKPGRQTTHQKSASG